MQKCSQIAAQSLYYATEQQFRDTYRTLKPYKLQMIDPFWQNFAENSESLKFVVHLLIDPRD